MPTSPSSQTRSTSKPLLVFDLDGTLADTAGDLIATLNWILTREGLPAVTQHTCVAMLTGWRGKGGGGLRGVY